MDSALKPTESPAAALVFESMQVPWVMPKHVVLTRVFKIHLHMLRIPLKPKPWNLIKSRESDKTNV